MDMKLTQAKFEQLWRPAMPHKWKNLFKQKAKTAASFFTIEGVCNV